MKSAMESLRENEQNPMVWRYEVEDRNFQKSGFYRIRRGKIRIIAEFRFEDSVVFIEVIDWRGNIY